MSMSRPFYRESTLNTNHPYYLAIKKIQGLKVHVYPLEAYNGYRIWFTYKELTQNYEINAIASNLPDLSDVMLKFESKLLRRLIESEVEAEG